MSGAFRLHPAATAATAAAALSLAIAAPAAATTPLVGVISARGSSDIGSGPVIDANSATWMGGPFNLFTSAHARAESGADYVDSSGAVSEAWSSADRGSIVLVGTLAIKVDDPAHASGAAAATESWSYEFTADSSGMIALDYDVTGSGDLFGLEGFNIGWDGAGGGLNLQNPFDPAAHGVFTRMLTGGQTYNLTISGGPDLGWSGGPTGERNGQVTGVFNFTIDGRTVPEPGTWTLMILGFGAVGVALRRQIPRVA